MYTQCPDCNTAFRVTADVLKQAAGKVRCGGCSNAFNALENLSEDIPEQPSPTDGDAAAPELTAEPGRNEDGSPLSVSPEQSAALMKTLDELEGSDIRIEDTGIEWRVMDDAEESDLIEDVTPEDLSAGAEELRFDDNTPLPDDFDIADAARQQAGAPDDSEPETKVELDPQSNSEFADVSLGEPGDWADILDEVEQPFAPAELPLTAELAALEETDEPPDVDTQFALQAAQMGIDTSAAQQSLPDVDEEPTRAHHFDKQEEDEAEDEIQIEVEDEDENKDDAPLEFGSIDTAMRQLEAQSDVFDADFFGASVATKSDGDETDHDEESGLDVLTLSEEEIEPAQEDLSSRFESIVMEGETVRTELDGDDQEADIAAAAMLGERIQQQAEETYAPRSGSRRAVALAIVALAFLLLLQVIHQSREELATVPAFNKVLSPIYRTVGMPLSPAWDVSGWRFEASPDELEVNADTGEEQLNIFPRIGNNSNSALPYPLVSVSLTDRFEATVGGRVLEPAEYLVDDVDPRKLVQPGQTFNAVISIQSPATEVTGYKLKVCYRLSTGQLRCNVPVFK